MQWFKDLPLFLEIEGLRVVHATWDENAIRLVWGRSFHDPHFLADAATKGTPEFTAVETLLKGPEIKLPDGYTSVDKEGTERLDTRVASWKSRKRKRHITYSDIAVQSTTDIPAIAVPPELLSSLPNYRRREPPVALPARARYCSRCSGCGQTRLRRGFQQSLLSALALIV